MKMISCEQLSYSDKCTYTVEDNEIVLRPYYGYNDRNKFDMREAVQIGCYANGTPKYEFIERVNGVAQVTTHYPIGE